MRDTKIFTTSVFSLVLTTLVIFFFLIPLKHTYAIWGMGDVVSDPGVLAESTISATTEIESTVNSVEDYIKEYVLDPLAYAAAGWAGQELASVIVNKVTGSGSGDEDFNFITDFGQHFQKEAAKQVGLFSNQLINESELSGNPFTKNIANSLAGTFQGTIEDGKLPQFTLKDTIGDQWELFKDDATIGGWAGYAELANPANTNIGSDILAKRELSRRIAEKLELERIKIESPGFLPDADCLMEAASTDSFTNVISGDTPDSISDYGQLAGDVIDTPCLVENIKTPQVTLSNAVNLGTGFAFDKLASSDEISEIISGVITSFVTSFIETGLSSVKGDLSQIIQEIGGPEDLLPGRSFNERPSRIVDLGKELEIAIQRTEEEVQILRETLSALDDFPELIVPLEQCIPGPDSGWEKRLVDFFTNATQAQRQKDTDSARDGVLVIDAGFPIAMQQMQSLKVDPYMNMPASGTMLSYGQRFAEKSSERSSVFNALNKKQGVLASLRNILSRVIGNSPTNIPPGMTLVYTNETWDTLTNTQGGQAVKDNAYREALRWAAQPENTNASDTEKRDLVKEYTWALWDQNGLEEQDSDIRDFIITEKTEARARFAGLDNDIANTGTIAYAKNRKEKALSENDEIQSLTKDCNDFKDLVRSIPGNPTNAQIKADLQNKLTANPNLLQSNELKQAILNPARSSMLELDCSTGGTPSLCPHRTYIGHTADETVSTSDFPNIRSQLEKNSSKNNFDSRIGRDGIKKRQIIPPPYTVKEMILADDNQRYLCEFTVLMGSWTEIERGATTGDDFSCNDTDEWYGLTVSDAFLRYYPRTR